MLKSEIYFCEKWNIFSWKVKRFIVIKWNLFLWKVKCISVKKWNEFRWRVKSSFVKSEMNFFLESGKYFDIEWNDILWEVKYNFVKKWNAFWKKVKHIFVIKWNEFFWKVEYIFGKWNINLLEWNGLVKEKHIFVQVKYILNWFPYGVPYTYATHCIATSNTTTQYIHVHKRIHKKSINSFI